MNAVFVIDLESAVAHLAARPGVSLVGVDLVRNSAKPLISVRDAYEFFAGRERVVVVPLAELVKVRIWARATCEALGEACNSMDADVLSLIEKWSRV